MVNVFSAAGPLLRWLMRLAGVEPQLVEIEPGTVMNIWVPTETANKTKSKPNEHKPSVVLVHGFAADGIQTWFLQVLALTIKYSVYVPDLIFFGGSITDKAHRSTSFQADCLAKCLRKLGVEKCTLVGLSYGGMVGFKMAKLHPDLVGSLVASGTVMELVESISAASLHKIGFSCWSDYLLPQTIEGVKKLLSVGTHKLPPIPDFVYRDFLEVMFKNRKEKIELLEALVISDEEAATCDYSQRIYLLWGDNDKIFNLDVAQELKNKLGEKASLQYVSESGHLLQIERPFVYNQRLKKILASLIAE